MIPFSFSHVMTRATEQDHIPSLFWLLQKVHNFQNSGTNSEPTSLFYADVNIHVELKLLRSNTSIKMHPFIYSKLIYV